MADELVVEVDALDDCLAFGARRLSGTAPPAAQGPRFGERDRGAGRAGRPPRRLWCDVPVADPDSAARAVAESALGHPVPGLIAAAGGRPMVAGSVAGDPPRARVAWVDGAGAVVARVACPPGRPSRWRPVVAAVVTLESGGAPADRVLVCRLAPEAAALRPVLAAEGSVPVTPAGPGGLTLVRLPEDGAAVIGVDAIDGHGEPVGRLARAGISELRADGASVGGRMGATHGMGAGIGAGRWAAGLTEAAFESGYDAWLPGWLPPGLVMSRPRVEPDVAYPAAPPALVLAWTGEDGRRVLLRQAPAPLASPDGGGRGARTVDVSGVSGVLRGRGLVTVVWETPERAFGLQVRGVPDGERVALRVARSVRPDAPPPGGADRPG